MVQSLSQRSPEFTAERRKTEWQVILVLALVQFTSFVDFMVVLPLGQQIMRSLNMDPSEFGAVVSSYTIAAGVVGFLATSFIDRIPRKTAFLTIYVGFLLGTLGCGLSTSFAALLAGRIFTGVFGGLLGGISMAIIGDEIPEQRRGQAMGVLMSSFALASVLGVPSSLFFGTRFGWNAPLLAIVAFGLPILVLGIRLIPPSKPLELVPSERVWTRYRAVFSNRAHLYSLGLTGLLMFGAFMVIPFITPYLLTNVALAESSLPIIYMIGGLSTLIAAPLLGKAADRYGKYFVFQIAIAISVVMLVVITVLPPVNLLIAIFVVTLLMICNTSRFVLAGAMIADCVESRFRGSFMSANTSTQHIASGLGAYAGSLILHQAPNGLLVNFGYVGFLGAFLTAGTLWFATRIRR